MDHFSNAQLQSNLQTDFDHFIQHVRHQEEYFLKIMQCINQVMNEQLQNQIYINQDISRYRQTIQQTKLFQPTFKQTYSNLLTKYQGKHTRSTSSDAFLKRVVYRILQMLFNNISLVNHKLPIIYQEYVRLKNNCLAILQQNGSNKPFQLIQTMAQYSVSKIHKYCQLLHYLVNHLENGNIDFVSHVQINLFLEKLGNLHFSYKAQQKRKSAFEIAKINKPKIEYEQTPKVQPIKEKAKIMVSRKIKKILSNIKEVLQINKTDFMNSLTNQNQTMKQQLYKELLLRNKINQQQICEFQTKKKKYQTKPSLENQLKKPIQKKEDVEIKIKSFQKIRKIRNNIKIKLVEKVAQRNVTLAENTSLQSTIQLNHQEQMLLKDADEQVTKDSQKTIEIENEKDKIFPILLKRKAASVDKNYKESDKNTHLQLRVLSSSIKINRLQPIVGIKNIKANLTPTESMNSSTQINQPTQKVIRYTKKLCF